MGRYAADTSVSSSASRAEIEKTIARYGASQFVYGWDEGTAIIMFRAHDRNVRFRLPLPDRNDPAFTHTPTRGTERSPAQAEAAWEQATRQRWRALALVVKAKLEAVEAGITEFEDEFGMHILMPDGRTVGEHVRPTIAQAYLTGTVPSSLLAIGPGT